MKKHFFPRKKGVFLEKKREKTIAILKEKKYTGDNSGAKWSKRTEKNSKVEEGEGVTGTYEHGIDAKGRLFIPAKLREELGVTFYLAMGVDACLAIYPQATWDRFTEKFASLPMSQSKAMRPLFANAARCELDSQGRIVIPQKLRRYAGLEKDAVIIGVHDRAEIWSKTAWEAQEEEEMTPEKMAACMAELGF